MSSLNYQDVLCELCKKHTVSFADENGRCCTSEPESRENAVAAMLRKISGVFWDDSDVAELSHVLDNHLLFSIRDCMIKDARGLTSQGLYLLPKRLMNTTIYDWMCEEGSLPRADTISVCKTLHAEHVWTVRALLETQTVASLTRLDIAKDVANAVVEALVADLKKDLGGKSVPLFSPVEREAKGFTSLPVLMVPKERVPSQLYFDENRRLQMGQCGDTPIEKSRARKVDDAVAKAEELVKGLAKKEEATKKPEPTPAELAETRLRGAPPASKSKQKMVEKICEKQQKMVKGSARKLEDKKAEMRKQLKQDVKEEAPPPAVVRQDDVARQAKAAREDLLREEREKEEREAAKVEKQRQKQLEAKKRAAEKEEARVQLQAKVKKDLDTLQKEEKKKRQELSNYEDTTRSSLTEKKRKHYEELRAKWNRLASAEGCQRGNIVRAEGQKFAELQTAWKPSLKSAKQKEKKALKAAAAAAAAAELASSSPASSPKSTPSVTEKEEAPKAAPVVEKPAEKPAAKEKPAPKEKPSAKESAPAPSAAAEAAAPAKAAPGAQPAAASECQWGGDNKRAFPYANMRQDVSGCSAFTTAAARCQIDDIQRLVKKEDVNGRDPNGWTPLVSAGYNGHTRVIWMMIEHKLDFKATTKTGETAMHGAALNGHTNTVRLLAEKGCPVNAQNSDGFTALGCASQNGRGECVAALLQAGADPNLCAAGRWSPLMTASLNGHKTCVDHLIQRGASVDAASEAGWTPLFCAARCAHIAICEELYAKGASLDAVNRIGETAILAAARGGHSLMSEWLVTKKVDVNRPNNDAWTPLLFAAKAGYLGVMRALLRANPDLEFKNQKGWTALVAACYSGKVEAVQMLLRHGASPELSTEGGWTLLMHAVKCPSAVLRLVLGLCDTISVNMQNDKGWTALMIAAKNNEVSAVKDLLEAGATVNMPKTAFGWSALQVACAEGHIDCVKQMLNFGALVSPKPGKGVQVPVVGAAKHGHVWLVNLLHTYGADLTAPDELGNSPLVNAVKQGHERVVVYLRDAGVNCILPDPHTGRTPKEVAAHAGHANLVPVLLSPPSKNAALPSAQVIKRNVEKLQQLSREAHTRYQGWFDRDTKERAAKAKAKAAAEKQSADAKASKEKQLAQEEEAAAAVAEAAVERQKEELAAAAAREAATAKEVAELKRLAEEREKAAEAAAAAAAAAAERLEALAVFDKPKPTGDPALPAVDPVAAMLEEFEQGQGAFMGVPAGDAAGQAPNLEDLDLQFMFSRDAPPASGLEPTLPSVPVSLGQLSEDVRDSPPADRPHQPAARQVRYFDLPPRPTTPRNGRPETFEQLLRCYDGKDYDGPSFETINNLYAHYIEEDHLVDGIRELIDEKKAFVEKQKEKMRQLQLILSLDDAEDASAPEPTEGSALGDIFRTDTFGSGTGFAPSISNDYSASGLGFMPMPTPLSGGVDAAAQNDALLQSLTGMLAAPPGVQSKVEGDPTHDLGLEELMKYIGDDPS